MKYETEVKGRKITIERDYSPIAEPGDYIAHQCHPESGKPVVGWGGYPNATQALADVKKNLH